MLHEGNYVPKFLIRIRHAASVLSGGRGATPALTHCKRKKGRGAKTERRIPSAIIAKRGGAGGRFGDDLCVDCANISMWAQPIYYSGRRLE